MLSSSVDSPKSALIPQEAPQLIDTCGKSFTIGLPKEIAFQENRIALTPEAAGLLVQFGQEVIVESGAGAAANYPDTAFEKAGARIVYSPREVYQSDIIVKIEPLVEQEFSYLKDCQTIISTLNLPSLQRLYFERLNQKRITGVAFEYLEDKNGNFPIVRAMSEIAGSSVMLIAAEYLSNVKQGQGIILGGITGIPPTNVVIIGAGTVAEYATRAALGLGASVKVFENQVYRLQRLKHTLGAMVSTAIIDSTSLTNAIRDADVVIAAMRSESGTSPLLVTEKMVQQMKPDAIIIDVSIDQGGCVETSEMTTLKCPTFKKHEVIHYCVPNIPSRVARTSSHALSNILMPLLLKIVKNGGIEEVVFNNSGFMKGVYCYRGSITKHSLAQNFDFRYSDLSLMKASSN